MPRRELSRELRAVVHQAGQRGVAARKDAVRYRRNGSDAMVNIRVLPMQDSVSGKAICLVLFEEVRLLATEPDHDAAADGTAEAAKDARIAELRRELDATRDYMQSVIENKEGTNEELENRNADLAVSNNDLTNLLSKGNLPILMLGSDLKIRQFTPQAEKLLKLIGADPGRLIGNIKPNIEIPALAATVREVVDRVAPHQFDGCIDARRRTVGHCRRVIQALCNGRRPVSIRWLSAQDSHLR